MRYRGSVTRLFGKHASELNVAEAAMLVGLVKSPSTYAPTVSLPRAVARRNVVLQAMLDANSIDRTAWQKARDSKVVLRDGLRADEPHGQYFKEQVRIELVQRFGWQRVYQGGLRVFSTVNMPLQLAAEAAVDDTLKSLDARRAKLAARRVSKKDAPVEPEDADPLQAALTAMDPETGHVRAMVGGRDFAESHFNRASQAHRQPGSAFKPFVYAAALEQGYSPATVIDHLDDPVATPKGAWTPEDEHSSASSMTLRTGLRTSSNRAAVRLLQQVGIARTVRYAKTLGVGDVPAVPSLALGSGEVTLQSMTAACRLRQSRHGAEAGSHSPRRGSRRPRAVDARDVSARGQRHDRVPALDDDGGRDQCRARQSRPADGVHAAGGGQDRHHQRLPRCLVRRLHAEDRHRCLGRVRSAAHDSAQRLCRGHRSAALGELHESRDARRQARVADAAVRRHERDGVSTVRQARTDGCQNAYVENPDGSTTYKSTVYRYSREERCRRRIATCIPCPPVRHDDRRIQ